MKLASVQKILQITPIEGAEFIEIQRKDKNQELIDKLDSVIVYGHNLSEQQKNKIEEIVMQYFTEKVKSLHNKYDHGEVNNIYNLAIFDVLELLK